MSEMLHGMHPIEGQTAPVILPLSGSVSPVRAPAVERFAFPELPEASEQSEPSRPLPVQKTSMVVWPDSLGAAMERACSETADRMLCQLSLERPTVVVLTSPDDGDGKTSLMIGLAPQLARRIGGGILVVDANSHNPTLTSRLLMPSGETAGRPALIYPTNLLGLNVLPVSPKPLSRDFDRSWIETLREGWPLVIFDAASLAHGKVASMASYCDGVYLVVRLGHTARRAVAQAARLIRDSGGKLLGCVVVG